MRIPSASARCIRSICADVLRARLRLRVHLQVSCNSKVDIASCNSECLFVTRFWYMQNHQESGHAPSAPPAIGNALRDAALCSSILQLAASALQLSISVVLGPVKMRQRSTSGHCVQAIAREGLSWLCRLGEHSQSHKRLQARRLTDKATGRYMRPIARNGQQLSAFLDLDYCQGQQVS